MGRSISGQGIFKFSSTPLWASQFCCWRPPEFGVERNKAHAALDEPLGDEVLALKVSRGRWRWSDPVFLS